MHEVSRILALKAVKFLKPKARCLKVLMALLQPSVKPLDRRMSNAFRIVGMPVSEHFVAEFELWEIQAVAGFQPEVEPALASARPDAAMKP